MAPLRQLLLPTLLALVWLGSATAARADLIHEPNNSPGKSFTLPVGQMAITDDLNGNVGRPATLLAQYTPTYSALLAMGSSLPGPAPNPSGNELFGVPLLNNGMAFFRVTGAPDSTFAGAHTVIGDYSITYKVYNPAHQLVKTVTKLDSVVSGMIDNLWLAPDNSIPNWTGYTTDVFLNNVVGPGTGDSLDFFTFTGLTPLAPFTAQLSNAQFSALIGLYNGNTLVSTGTLVSGIPTISGFADSMGRAKFGITGAGDNSFVGAHGLTGQYTLQLVMVPEPASIVLLGSGAALATFCWRKRRRKPRAQQRAIRT